jgi:hypothetical protein
VRELERFAGSQEAAQPLHIDWSSLHAASATFDIMPSIEDGSLAMRVIERELVWQGRFSIDDSTKVWGRFDIYLREALAYLGLTLYFGHRATVRAVFDKFLKQVGQFLDPWFSRPRWRLDQNIETQTRRLMADTIRA